MKKYTTLLCLLLALVMVMACFTGCAKQPAQSDPADTTEPAQTTDTTPEDSTPAEPADTRETVNIRFAQFGNNLDDLDGYANDPIKAAIEQAVATRDFRPSPSKLCGWCDFKPLCPAFGGTPPSLPETIEIVTPEAEPPPSPAGS